MSLPAISSALTPSLVCAPPRLIFSTCRPLKRTIPLARVGAASGIAQYSINLYRDLSPTMRLPATRWVVGGKLIGTGHGDYGFWALSAHAGADGRHTAKLRIPNRAVWAVGSIAQHQLARGHSRPDLEPFLGTIGQTIAARVQRCSAPVCARSTESAKRKGHISANPAEDIEPIQRDRPQPRALSDSRVRELLAALDTLTDEEGQRNRVIVRTFLLTAVCAWPSWPLWRSEISTWMHELSSFVRQREAEPARSP